MSLQQVLAPQLQQSLALLQAPTLELKAMVEQELQQNPVLEEVASEDMEQKDKDHDGELPPTASDTTIEQAPDSFDTQIVEKPSNDPVDDFQAEFEKLIQLDQEWRDHFSETNIPMRVSAEDEEKRQFMFDSLVAGTSLQENLLEQMRLSDLSEENRPIAELIIGNIDDYGYLKTSVEELALGMSNYQVTFTKTDGMALALGDVTRWSENFNTETPEQPGTVRRQPIRTVEASGRFKAPPTLSAEEHDSFLQQRKEEWMAALQGVDGSLTLQGIFNRTIHLLEFNAELDGNAIKWNLAATYPATADDHDLVAIKAVVEQRTEGADHMLCISGRVAAAGLEIAARKLEVFRKSILQSHGAESAKALRKEAREETAAVDDGSKFVQMVFDEQFLLANGAKEKVWISPEKVLKVLTAIQTFHPPGVAARDLRECLMLQLDRDGRRKSTEYAIIDQHMEALGKRRLPEIARGLGVSVDEIQKAVVRIALLEPRPGRAFLPDNDQYILPEVFVNKSGDEFTVATNNEQIPHLRISNTYKDLMAQADSSSEVRDYIREKIRAGKFLIKSLQQRQETILNIAKEIVNRQREFMEKGVAHLKPMTMVQVAQVVGVHETTVSRAVSAKYMQTPQGIFEMKYFFTSGIQTASGEGMSNTSVKDIIAELFKKEDPHSPLSDQEVVKILGDKGIKIARRTVAKYRSELNILPSNLRKVY
jgi:RNA polymerase sigma-54 factor